MHYYSIIDMLLYNCINSSNLICIIFIYSIFLLFHGNIAKFCLNILGVIFYYRK